MNKLYVFGDSYTTPYVCVDPQDSFWGLAGKHLGVEQIINVSQPGNSVDSVCQLLIGMQNQYKYNWKEDFFIIGLPPLERITIFDNHKNTEYKSKIFDRDWNKIYTTIEAHRGLVSKQFYGEDQFLITHADPSWTETQILREIYLLTKWLDGVGANYLICNVSKTLNENNLWGPSEFVLKHAIDHDRCLLFDNTYHSVNYNIHKPADYDLYGWNGHHGAEGNKLYYETSIKDKLKV
jgi:hypothetical protein